MYEEALALLVNDFHVDKYCIEEFEKNWDEALSVCGTYNCWKMIVGGDLFTARASQPLSVLMAVRDALLKSASLGISVTLANGNHDKVDQEAFHGYCNIFAPYRKVDVVDKFKFERFGKRHTEVYLAIMSYFPENGSFMEHYQEMCAELYKHGMKKRETILYLHEGIRGALGGIELPDELPPDIFSGFRKVLVGHYHNRFIIDKTNIRYIGSSREHNFGEEGGKGYTLLFDDGTIKHVPNKVNIRHKTISVNYSELNYGNYLPLERLDMYKYRLRVRCTSAEAQTVNRQALLEQGFSKVELVTEKTKAVSVENSGIEQKFDKNAIQLEYSSFCEGRNIDSALGLKYLKQIND